MGNASSYAKTTGSRKNDCLVLVFFVLLWVILFVFYYIAHPLIIYDTDDWNNSTYLRRALPIWGYFNPTKILPETLMPVVADIGAFVFYPISHDYIRALSLSYALAVSLCIVLYVYIVWKLFIFWSGNKKVSLLSACLFLLFHFLLFKNSTDSNTYLLYAKDVTCYFHYIIPDLLCAGLVSHYMTKTDEEILCFWKKAPEQPLRAGIVVLVLYLALNSNILSTIILAAYAFVRLVHCLCRSRTYKKKGAGGNQRLSGGIFWVVILGIWLVTLIFEMNGGRANDIEVQGDTFGRTVIANFHTLAATVLSLNRMFLLVAALFLLTAVGIAAARHQRGRFFSSYVDLFAAGIITAVYDVLVSAKAGGSYIYRSDVLFGIFFYCLLFVCLLILDVTGRISLCQTVLPLLTFVIFIQTINLSKPFKESNMYNLPYECVLAVDQDIVDQVVKADLAGQEEVTIVLPENRSEVMNDWAYKEFSGQMIADTLYYHGVISRRIEANAVLDSSVNQKYGIIYQ